MRIMYQTPSSDAVEPFDVNDRGLLLSDGVFDTSRIIQGRIVFETAHLDRLRRSADYFAITWPTENIADCLEKLRAAHADGILRITITRGPSARGVAAAGITAPTVIAQVSPVAPNQQNQTLALHTSAIRRNETAPTSRYKTLAYMDAVHAGRLAMAAGFDLPLFLNSAGRVACTSIGNIFAIYGKRLATPPQSEGVIAGIIRQWIIENAVALGYTVEETPLELHRLKQADSVFMTNSVRLVCPVSQIDETALAVDVPSDLNTALMDTIGAF